MNNKCVPNIISTKDLDFLQDIYNWNYGAYKNAISMLNNISDEKINRHINKCSKEFYNTMNKILDILKDGKANE